MNTVYVLAIKQNSAKKIRNILRKEDSSTKVIEGNPKRMWINTSMDMCKIGQIKHVEDIVISDWSDIPAVVNAFDWQQV